MALRYRYAGVFTLTTFTIILTEELCSAETFQPEQNRSYQRSTFFRTSCIFRNWTHRYSVSIFKTDDSQDCRPGLAERCSRPRLHEKGPAAKAVGRIAPTGRTGPRAPADSRHRISFHENVSSRTKCIGLRTLPHKNVLTRTNCTIAKRLKRYLPNVSNL